MPLFCIQCNGRRLPIFQYTEKLSLWLCKTCENFVDSNDEIIREFTQSEKDEMNTKLEEFGKSIESITSEKLTRRKGVN